MATRVAGVIIPAAPHNLVAQQQPAVGVALPRKPSHWKVPSLPKGHLKLALSGRQTVMYTYALEGAFNFEGAFYFP